jgi:tetratricopeptide (TPR) repeat protein
MYLRRFPHSFLTFAETDHSVMRQLCLRTLLLASGAALCSGCSILESKEQKSYETIEANERYDTETARKEHEKALKLLDKSQHGKPAKLAEAEVHLQKALVADITYGPAHNSLGIVYMRQRNFYTAAWEFEYAAKLMPEHFEPLYNLGQLYESADKLENTILYYEQALTLAPRNPAVIGNLANAMLRSGRDFDEVRPLLEMLVFHDNRGEWIAWAQDQLGRKPIQMVSAESFDRSSDSQTPETEPQSIPDDSPSGDRDFPSLQSAPQADAPAFNSFPLPIPLSDATGRASLSEE